jgi:hypothetical protein
MPRCMRRVHPTLRFLHPADRQTRSRMPDLRARTSGSACGSLACIGAAGPGCRSCRHHRRGLHPGPTHAPPASPEMCRGVGHAGPARPPAARGRRGCGGPRTGRHVQSTRVGRRQCPAKRVRSVGFGCRSSRGRDRTRLCTRRPRPGWVREIDLRQPAFRRPCLRAKRTRSARCASRRRRMSRER